MAKWLEKIKLEGEQEFRWFHVSSRGDTTIYREIPYPFPTRIEFVLGTQSFESERKIEQHELNEIGELIQTPPSQVPLDEIGTWARFAAEAENPTEAKKVIPITKIRKLYEFLRDDIGHHDFQMSLLDSFSKTPQNLISMCVDSFKSFGLYENGTEGWTDTGRTELPNPQPLSDARNTGAVVAAMQLPQMTDPISATYVAYEVNPRRTSRAIFQNGLSATSSGLGGIDILLRRNDDTPVVGEIKVANDENPFYALIQSLTYAIELATPKQLARLREHGVYGTNPFINYAGTCVDICVILVNHTRSACLEQTKRLATEIVKELPFIGEITFVKNEGDKLITI